MDKMQEAITQMTGAINAQLGMIKLLQAKLDNLEQKNQQSTSQPIILQCPKTEQDLKDIDKLPDAVKELQIFNGNPTEYISWVHNVENILTDYEIVKHKPIYRAILQNIRQKIRGSANGALISHNIFDSSWEEIKSCLSLHYADKRDVRTLVHQLSNLTQKNLTIDEYYANINHQLSLIINKIKTETYGADTIQALSETYRNSALDVFIRGLNGDLSRMLMIQRPQTLPEAYFSCLEIQNTNFRSISIHDRNFRNKITPPVNHLSNRKPGFNPSQPRNSYYQHNGPENHHQPYQNPHSFNGNFQATKEDIPTRPTQPKPPVPMDIAQTVQTRQVNYMNRPTFKRSNDSNTIQRKQQRIFNLEVPENEPYYEEQPEVTYEHEPTNSSYEYEIPSEEEDELNFILPASQAYLT